MSLAECQNNPIDVNFHLQIFLEMFDKKSADTFWSKMKGGGKCPPSCQLGQKQLLPLFSELQFFWPPCPDFINNLKLAPKINSQYVRWKFSHKLAYLGQLPTISSHKELSNTLTLKVKFLVKPNFFKLWNSKVFTW